MERAPNSFISAYNVAVTLEKIGRRSESAEWFTRAATLFERTKFRGRLPGEIAGSLQAIGRAYASTGDPKRAINLLNESMAIAKTVPTTIFSFVQYRNVSALDFMRENETLMANFLGHSPQSRRIKKPRRSRPALNLCSSSLSVQIKAEASNFRHRCRAVLKSRTGDFVFSIICLDLTPKSLAFNRGQLYLNRGRTRQEVCP